MQYFTLEEVLELHFNIIEDYGGSHGVRDESRLKSLLEAPQLVTFGVEQYATVYDKAAVYMRNTIADHILTDGNKPTGTTLAVIFLMRNQLRLTATPRELEDFAVSVATDHLTVEAIATWLRAHTAEQP